MKRYLCFAIFLTFAVSSAWAQAIKVPESWDRLASKADEVVKVTMDRNMLQFASKFMDDEGDKEGKQLVSKLNGIYVRSLTFKNKGSYSEADVQPIRAQLQGPEWSHMVEVDSKADKEKVDIYLKTVNNQTLGMVILSEEATELTLVHLDGAIDPRDLDHLSGNFGIPKGVHAPKGAKDKAAK